jgi:1,4-alpha-glucan branching enzyme
MYGREPALHQVDFDPAGFEWVDCNDLDYSTVSLLRRAGRQEEVILAVCNFTPVPQSNYRTGVPRGGRWVEILNSDARDYGGSGWGNMGGMEASPIPYHGRPFSLNLTLPPLAAVFFKPQADPD